MRNLLLHEIGKRRVAIIAWGLGLTAFAAIYITIYPEVAEEMGSLSDLFIYQLMGMDLASFGGFIASVVVQIMPIILGVYVIIASTSILAGEEENGTLEMMVTLPLPRWQIFAAKAAALAVALLLILVILAVGSALILGFVVQTAEVEVDVTSGQLLLALLSTYPLMLAFLGIGLFLGAFMPSRRLAVGAMTVIYIASYVLQSLAAVTESLAFLETFSLFAYVDTTSSVFTEGVNVVNMLILLLVAALFTALAVTFFQRRNLTVGMWPWQRGQIPA